MPVRFASGSCVLLTLALLVGIQPALAQTPAPATARRTLRATTIPADEVAPTIDGHVSEDVWLKAPPFSEFTQQDPVEGAPATERTDIRVILSPTHVYVGAICFDSEPSSIILSQSRRDASLNDTDSIILIFDTFNDNQNAFVFGTNPVGIEYDGQVSREGQTSGIVFAGGAGGGGGGQRGGISSFNPNWDGDWIVRAQVTERGWEAEMAIPLKTLRYSTGTDMTWGFNVLRNIRHKNEQVYLSPIPRGYNIYRISQAAKLTGLMLPTRRDIKLIPYALASSNKDFTRPPGDQTHRRPTAGVDLKWGVRPNVTIDATVNTDFAQVEADEEQVNLTRFDLFFPEKRPFFLENASTFQFGQPQSIDLFFSRRIGLSGSSASGRPIDIIAGSRLSGKLAGSWNVGFLNIQTGRKDMTREEIAPATNFSVFRTQKEVGRSSYGAIFVGKYVTDETVPGTNHWNRAYGADADIQLSDSQRASFFIARTDSPGETGSDQAGRAFYNFTNDLWQVSGGFSQVGDQFNPEVGFLPRRGFRRPEFRTFLTYQPKSIEWIRRFSPHLSTNAFYGLDGTLETSFVHMHPFEIQPAYGGRFGWFVDRNQDRPTRPFVVYDRDGRQVVIPPGFYTWWQNGFEFQHDPSARITAQFRMRLGHYYNGDYNSIEITSDYRFSAQLTASLGWTRQDATLPSGAFVTHLVPIKASYSFTPLASLSALLQHNGQTGQFSSNIRLAILNRSGTGLFLVYNDRRDFTDYTSQETLGRSFVVKYTRLIDF